MNGGATVNTENMSAAQEAKASGSAKQAHGALGSHNGAAAGEGG